MIEEDYRIILRPLRSRPALWGTAASFDEATSLCSRIRALNPDATLLVLHVIDREDTVYLFHAGALIRIDASEFRV